MAFLKCFLLSTGFMFLGVFSSTAQLNDGMLTELSGKWKNAMDYAVAIAEAMPDSVYNFKPVKEEMSFAEQLLHIAQNINWLSAEYLLQTKAEAYSGQQNKKNIIEYLKASYGRGATAHVQLSANQLNETVPFFAGPKTRRQILFLLHDHQSHHVGQLIVYLRLNGIKPPAYVGW